MKHLERVRTILSDFLKERDKAFCFMTSAPGTGKTFVLRRYCKEHKSAFYMKLPLLVSPRSLILGILQSIEIPVMKRYQSELVEIVKVALLKKQVTVIVIAHHTMGNVFFGLFSHCWWAMRACIIMHSLVEGFTQEL